MRLFAENLEGERGGRTVFSGVGFALAPGDGLVVTGPNGAGKSTLLRVIAGLLPAARGTVKVDGGGETFATPAAASHYLGHLNAMKPTLSLLENLSFWRDFLGEPEGLPASRRPASSSVEDALETVGLAGIGYLPFAFLSAGQRRRAAIARLLVCHRPVWLLDEPTTGLDRASERQFFGLMRGHLDGGGIIVAATHLPLGLEGAGELKLGSTS